MSEVSERAQNRLENLLNIEPLLGSLRVMSLSTMQMAINRKANLNRYKIEFLRVLNELKSVVDKNEDAPKVPESSSNAPLLLVILGSERGICGTYNKNLADLALEWQSNHASPFTIISFGKRVGQVLNQVKLTFEHQGSIAQGSMPQYHKAYEMINTWQEAFKSGQIQGVEILSFRKPNSGFYKPILTSLLPSYIPVDEPSEHVPSFPPPIIEGDPLPMIKRTHEHLIALRFYELILESIEAENAVRYNLLEEARENTKELIETLTVEVQIAKRQAVTQQLQELAAGAGLSV